MGAGKGRQRAQPDQLHQDPDAEEEIAAAAFCAPRSRPNPGFGAVLDSFGRIWPKARVNLGFGAEPRPFQACAISQRVAAIFTTELGAPPPLLPTRLSPVTFLKLEEILDAPNEILETDSDRVIEAKKACTEAKKMMKEHIAAGGDPEKFLESYYSMLKQASEEWKTAQMSLMQTIRTDPGLAITMEAEINENFTARGIRPVKIPPQFKERYGIK